MKPRTLEQINPISYSMEGAAAATGYSRSYLYLAIKAGKLKAYRRGKRTFVLADDLRRYVLSELKPISELTPTKGLCCD